MPLFLTILEGPTPADARPIVAISDAKIISSIRSLLMKRLSGGSPGAVVPLRKSPRPCCEEGPGQNMRNEEAD
jgi:hypothetical protein